MAFSSEQQASRVSKRQRIDAPTPLTKRPRIDESCFVRTAEPETHLPCHIRTTRPQQQGLVVLRRHHTESIKKEEPTSPTNSSASCDPTSTSATFDLLTRGIPQSVMDALVVRYSQYVFRRKIHEMDDCCMTPLMEAAWNNDEASVVLLLQDPNRDQLTFSMNIVDHMNWSALTCAVKKGNFHICRLLVQNGAKASVQDLCHAAQDRNAPILRLLLQSCESAGAGAGAEGQTPNPIVNHSAYIESRRQTPLLCAIEGGGGGDNNNVDIVRLLLEFGAATDYGGNSSSGQSNTANKWLLAPLLSAIRTKNIDVVRLLVEHGANPNGTTHCADATTAVATAAASPLLMAITTGQIDAMRLLLEYGANANGPNEVGEHPQQLSSSTSSSPLHEAAKQPNAQAMVRLLLTHGADTNAKDVYGNTPIIYSIASKQKAVTQILTQGQHQQQYRQRKTLQDLHLLGLKV